MRGDCKRRAGMDAAGRRGICSRATRCEEFALPPEFGHRPWHVAFTCVAVALVAAGGAFALVAGRDRAPLWRIIGKWLTVLGAGLGVPAWLLGVYGLFAGVRAAGGDGGTEPANYAWYQLVRAAGFTTAEWRALERYVWRGGIGTIVLGLTVAAYAAAPDRWRGRLRIRCGLLVGFAAVALLIDLRPGDVVARAEWAAPSAGEWHVIVAGLTISMAVGSAAASVRRRVTRRTSEDTLIADGANDGRARIAFGLCFLGAVLTGFYVAGWRAAQVVAVLQQPRDQVHAVLAGGIVVLVTVGLVSRRRRRRWTWVTVAVWVLLALALCGLLGTGLLMLFDGSDEGSLPWRFREPFVQTPE